MPHYIFTRVKGDATWELVEVVKGADAARKALADYRSFLKDRKGAEVVSVEAKTVEKAREKLEFNPSDASI